MFVQSSVPTPPYIIHTMESLVLLFLLAFFSGFHLKAQLPKVKDLLKEKIIYLDANRYIADNSGKNAHSSEKFLYDIIKKRSLNIEKIIYSGAYLNNAPLFMTFQDFENRIKNTDFSIYNRDKK